MNSLIFWVRKEAQEEPKEMEDKEEGGEGGAGWTLAGVVLWSNQNHEGIERWIIYIYKIIKMLCFQLEGYFFFFFPNMLLTLFIAALNLRCVLF